MVAGRWAGPETYHQQAGTDHLSVRVNQGIPIGRHFERRIYDDLVTEDAAESIDQLEKVKVKFDSSQNLGREGGHHRIVGTYYHHCDPLTYIGDKKYPDGRPAYLLRLKPGSDDGTATGKPVLDLLKATLDELKLHEDLQLPAIAGPLPHRRPETRSRSL